MNFHGTYIILQGSKNECRIGKGHTGSNDGAGLNDDDWLISLSALEKMTANEKTRTASTSLKSQLALKKRTENMPIFDIACDMWKMTSYLAASDDSLFSLFNFSESETKYEL